VSFNYQHPLKQLSLVGIILLLLSGPYILGKLGLIDQAYSLATHNQCNHLFFNTHLQENMTSATLDIAFLGSSDIEASINPIYIQEQLSKIQNRPAQVINFGCPNSSTAHILSSAKALLEKRKVSMLVVELQNLKKNSSYKQNEPYALLWWKFYENYHLTSKLSLKEQLSLYSESVLGTPLHIYNILKTNNRYGLALHVFDSQESNKNPDSQKTISKIDPANDLSSLEPDIQPVNSYINYNNSHLNSVFFKRNFELTEKQILFFKELKKITEMANTKLVFSVPILSADFSSPVELPNNLSNEFDNIPIVAIPENWLLKNKSEIIWQKTIKSRGWHRNKVGQRLYTESVSPVLINLLGVANEK
jgi:hypothetical protein